MLITHTSNFLGQNTPCIIASCPTVNNPCFVSAPYPYPRIGQSELWWGTWSLAEHVRLGKAQGKRYVPQRAEVSLRRHSTSTSTSTSISHRLRFPFLVHQNTGYHVCYSVSRDTDARLCRSRALQRLLSLSNHGRGYLPRDSSMASPEPSASASSAPAPRPKATDPILRNTLRYTVSAREYASLHRYILSRSRVLRRAAPSPSSVERALQPKQRGDGDYNARAVRHALRVFAATWLGMKGWEGITSRMGKKECVIFPPDLCTVHCC